MGKPISAPGVHAAPPPNALWCPNSVIEHQLHKVSIPQYYLQQCSTAGWEKPEVQSFRGPILFQMEMQKVIAAFFLLPSLPLSSLCALALLKRMTAQPPPLSDVPIQIIQEVAHPLPMEPLAFINGPLRRLHSHWLESEGEHSRFGGGRSNSSSRWQDKNATWRHPQLLGPRRDKGRRAQTLSGKKDRACSIKRRISRLE